MKEYVKPQIEIEDLFQDDIICTSGCEPVTCEQADVCWPLVGYTNY